MQPGINKYNLDSDWMQYRLLQANHHFLICQSMELQGKESMGSYKTCENRLGNWFSISHFKVNLVHTIHSRF